MVSYPCLLIGLISAWFYYQWMQYKWKFEKCHTGSGGGGSSTSDYYDDVGGSSGGSTPAKEKHSSYEFWTWVWTIAIFFIMMWLCQNMGTGGTFPL